MGLNTNIESELTILANTIKPYAGDFFYLDSLGEKYLFKVTEVQDDLIRTKPIYRISFKLSKIQDEKSYKEIEEQVIESYTTIFNNIGTDNECIVKSSVFRAIDKINKITDKLNKVFIRNFYDELFNVMRFRINTLDTEIYNRYLNKFLIDNEILKESNERSSFYSTVKLVEYLPTDSTFDAVYEKTIYYAVESQSVKQFFDRMFSFIDVNYNHAPWFRSNKDYKDFVPLTDDEEVQNEHIMDFIDKEFYGRIKINQPYNNENDYFMENLIIRYINGDNSLPDEKLLDMINENIWRADMRSYIFIPIINFILRRLIRNETIKQL